MNNPLNEISLVFEKIAEFSKSDLEPIQMTGSFRSRLCCLSGSKVGKLAILDSTRLASADKFAGEKMICNNFEVRIV
jgi:hypothetical protein